MNQGKKVAFVTKASIVRAEDIWVNDARFAGKFVLRAVMVVDKLEARDELAKYRGVDKFTAGEEVRTSFLVRVDLENNEFETMNTIYKVVPEVETDVYRMCLADPT
jgi:hypothetical protein